MATIAMQSLYMVMPNSPPCGQQSLTKQESCSSIVSSTTIQTATLSLEGQSSEHFSRTNKLVRFALDEFSCIVEEVFEYPAIEDEYKADAFWSQQDVEKRRDERYAMILDNNEDREQFISFVEELFDVPIRKRHSKQRLQSAASSESETEPLEGDFVSTVSAQRAIQELSLSEYRGYEQKCVRSIASLRRRSIHQIITAYWVRGGQQLHEVAVKLSHRQARFARLVAQSDEIFASQYLGRTQQ